MSLSVCVCLCQEGNVSAESIDRFNLCSWLNVWCMADSHETANSLQRRCSNCPWRGKAVVTRKIKQLVLYRVSRNLLHVRNRSTWHFF